MTIKELMACIEKLSPGAKVTVCQGYNDSQPYAVWDSSHKGVIPTFKDCEAVLTQVRADMVVEQERAAKEAIIQAEEKKLVRGQAIKSLIEKGVLKE